MSPACYLLLLAVLGLCPGCFRAPDEDVMFSCDPAEGDAACPSGYVCADDGCCHREDKDPAEGAGSCRLVPGLDSVGTGATGDPQTTDPTSDTDTGSGSQE